MRVTVSLEQRFHRTPDGRIWAAGGLDARFWDTYLGVFDAVRVLARVSVVAEPPARCALADGPGVSFAPMPYYIGPAQLLARLPAVVRAASAHAQADDAYVLRVPSFLASFLAYQLARRSHPYSVEVVGNPYDVFAPGTIDHPLRPLLRHWTARELRRQCSTSQAALYVTDQTLQARYPCSGPAFGISDIRLEPDAIAAAPRAFSRPAKRLVFVGSLEQLYKAPDVLLHAVAMLVATGHDLALTIVGDGRHRAHLEASPVVVTLGQRVRFLGWLPGGEAVRRELDAADVFVLPSRTEGLPRALVEAMARGLPCVGSSAGGIPELLPPEYLANPGDPAHLATILARLVTDPPQLTSASARNLARARAFSSSVLGPRRAAFYRAVKESTEKALSSKRSSEQVSVAPSGD